MRLARILMAVLALSPLAALAQVDPVEPSAAQVTAGTLGPPYFITPRRLAGAGGGGGGSGTTTTNIAQGQINLARNISQFDGDSQTAYTNAAASTNTWPVCYTNETQSALFKNTRPLSFNYAQSGDYMTNMDQEYPSEAGALKPGTNQFMSYTLNAGVNDTAVGVSNSVFFNSASNTYRLARADGKIVIASTFSPNFGSMGITAYSNRWFQFNQSILSMSNMWDACVRGDLICNNSNKTVDGLHMNRDTAEEYSRAVLDAIQGSRERRFIAYMTAFQIISPFGYYTNLTSANMFAGTFSGTNSLTVYGSSATFAVTNHQMSLNGNGSSPEFFIGQGYAFGIRLSEQFGTGFSFYDTIATGSDNTRYTFFRHIFNGTPTTYLAATSNGNLWVPNSIQIDGAQTNLDLAGTGWRVVQVSAEGGLRAVISTNDISGGGGGTTVNFGDDEVAMEATGDVASPFTGQSLIYAPDGAGSKVPTWISTKDSTTIKSAAENVTITANSAGSFSVNADSDVTIAAAGGNVLVGNVTSVTISDFSGVASMTFSSSSESIVAQASNGFVPTVLTADPASPPPMSIWGRSDLPAWRGYDGTDFGTFTFTPDP